VTPPGTIVVGDEAEGARVVAVPRGLPAANGGVRAGDVVETVAGYTVSSSSDVVYVIKNLRPGQRVPIVVRRGDQTKNLSVRLIDVLTGLDRSS
jgi:S1-C subfamily serine protease